MSGQQTYLLLLLACTWPGCDVEPLLADVCFVTGNMVPLCAFCNMADTRWHQRVTRDHSRFYIYNCQQTAHRYLALATGKRPHYPPPPPSCCNASPSSVLLYISLQLSNIPFSSFQNTEQQRKSKNPVNLSNNLLLPDMLMVIMDNLWFTQTREGQERGRGKRQ